MSQLIPLYIAGPFAPRGEEQGRGTELRSAGVCAKNIHFKQSVRIYMSIFRLKIKARNPSQQTSMQISVCVKIVKRHHLTLRWVYPAASRL